MLTQPNTINLIRTKTSSSSQLDSIESSLRRTGYIGLVIFLCLSVILGSVYMFFSIDNQNLQKQKLLLVDRINAQKNKEGILLAIKDRTKLVQKVMITQKPWTKILDLVSSYATAPFITNIVVDEQNKVVLSVRSNSLDDVLIMVNTIISQATQNQIKNPRLVSFQVNKKSGVELTISFIALF